MKKIKWSIYEGGKFVSSGTLEAECDKDALSQVMLEQDGKLEPDKSYVFTSGALTTSSYGDELARSAHVASHGMDENAPMDAPHHFQPNPEDIGLSAPVNPDWERVAEKMLKDSVSRTPVDTGALRDHWAQSARDAHERTKVEQERKAGRHTFTPTEAAEIIKRVVGRDVYCGNNPVWTQEEVDQLIGKLRCPAAPSGPNGHHEWSDILGSKGEPGCKGLGHERCLKCGNCRAKRRWPKQADGINAPQTFDTGKRTPITKSRQRRNARHRQVFADMNGVSVDEVEVSFLHDKVTFSLKD